MRDRPRTRLPSPSRDGGPPLALPRPLDALSDAFWGLGPRQRAALVGLGVAVLTVLAAARGLSAPYGTPQPVLVASVDLPAGTVLADTDGLHAARWPADLVPQDATLEVTGVLRGALPAGAVLTDGHRAVDGLGALAGPGRAAVPVPREALPSIAPGDRVQVVDAEPDGQGRLLADHVEVLAVDDEAVWLAVTLERAADVAASGVRGTSTVTVLPP